MCGIVGAAGNLEYRDKELVEMLMHFCQLRGEDSTGFFTVAKTEKHSVSHKVVGPTRYLFESTAWDRLTLASKRVFIGHCRKATVGAIKRSTAHPFTYGDITGVHNGTLKNWRYLPGVPEETDSATLYENFSRVGVRETIEAVDGAYALIWWDEGSETINVLRNNERPLFYCFDEKFEKIFWASEPWMLSVATDKCGVKRANLSPREPHATTILPVDTDTWWRIKPGRGGSKDALVFHGEAEGHVEEVKGGVNPAKYSAPPFQPGSYKSPFTPPPAATPVAPVVANLPALRHASPAVTQGRAESTSTKPSSSDTGKTESSSAPKGSQPSRPTLTLVHDSKSDGSDDSDNEGLVNEKGEPIVLGFNGLCLTKAEFEAFVDPNCIWCQGPIAFDEIIEDPDIIGDWTDDDSFICNGCVTNTHGYKQGAF